MSIGLAHKVLREIWRSTLIFGIGLFLVEFLLTRVLPQLSGPVSELMLEVPFIKAMISSMMGTEIGEEFTVEMIQSFLWVHPTVLALYWGHAIAHCTRFPAGEVDRGTIDVLLGWPLSRARVYAVESAICLAAGLMLTTLTFLGHTLSAGGMHPNMRPSSSLVALVLVNLYASYLAVSGVTYLISALHDSRARAVGWAAGVVLGSFLINFLAPFWGPAQRVAFLSISNYYRPTDVILEHALPWGNVAALLGIAAFFWVLGGVVVRRRSLCTT